MVTTTIRQFVCGVVHGHDAVLHFERGRISLLCTSCGHKTPGWQVKERKTADARGQSELTPAWGSTASTD